VISFLRNLLERTVCDVKNQTSPWRLHDVSLSPRHLLAAASRVSGWTKGGNFTSLSDLAGRKSRLVDGFGVVYPLVIWHSYGKSMEITMFDGYSIALFCFANLIADFFVAVLCYNLVAKEPARRQQGWQVSLNHGVQTPPYVLLWHACGWIVFACVCYHRRCVFLWWAGKVRMLQTFSIAWFCQVHIPWSIKFGSNWCTPWRIWRLLVLIYFDSFI